MYYITEWSLDQVFDLIRDAYTAREQVPDYRGEQEGIAKLIGVLKMAQADEYYPDLLSKATHIFVGINKGHFFSNGNKRLALVCATLFLALNNSELSTIHPKDEHKTKLKSAFPSFENFEDDSRFFPEEFGLYNLSIIVADSHAYIDGNFDTLKAVVRDYLDFAINPPHSGRLKSLLNH